MVIERHFDLHIFLLQELPATWRPSLSQNKHNDTFQTNSVETSPALSLRSRCYVAIRVFPFSACRAWNQLYVTVKNTASDWPTIQEHSL